MKLRPLALVALLTVTTAILGFLLAANIVVSATSPEQRRGQSRASHAREAQPASPPSSELRKLQLIEEVREHASACRAWVPACHVLMPHSRALQAATSGWNRTRSVLLLGLKARRDFHVYDWPFRQHGFKVP